MVMVEETKGRRSLLAGGVLSRRIKEDKASHYSSITDARSLSVSALHGEGKRKGLR